MNAPEYGRRIIDMAKRRELLAVAREIEDRAFMLNDGKAGTIAEEAEASLYAIHDQDAPGSGLAPIADAVTTTLRDIEAAMKRGDGMSGLPVGLLDVDEALGGMDKEDLIIVAGATGQGKTAFALGVAEANALAGKSVAFFSHEMSREQLTARLLARKTGIGVSRMQRGRISQAEFMDVFRAGNDLKGLPIHIEDAVNVTVPNIRARCRRLQKSRGLDLAVIDYLQLLQATGRYKGQRHNEVSEISRGLKLLAKELKVPIMALCQLSRAVDQREEKRPRKSDLRESGSLEQDADKILMLFRPEYYVDQKRPTEDAFKDEGKYVDAIAEWETQMDRVRGKAEIVVSKNRKGPTKTINVHFDGERMRFGNLHKQEAF